MNIYFAGAIRGGRDLQPIYSKIVEHLQSNGHEVLTVHVAQKNVLSSESRITPQEIYQRDMNWLQQCDLVIADVTVPSLGVGYEIAFALVYSKPILCLCQEGVNLSAMITGDTHEGLEIEYYSDGQGAVTKIDSYLQSFKTNS